MLVIRKMEKRDAAKAAEIDKELFSVPWSAKSFEETLKQGNTCYLVGEEDGEIKGYCGFYFSFDEGEITNVAVRQKFQGCGIGRKLMEALLKKSKDMGVRALLLEVRKSNWRAVHLYETLGFQVDGVRKNFYEKPAEDALVMWLHTQDDSNFH